MSTRKSPRARVRSWFLWPLASLVAGLGRAICTALLRRTSQTICVGRGLATATRRRTALLPLLVTSAICSPTLGGWQAIDSSVGLPTDSVISFYDDEQGVLWFGAWRGAIRYDGAEFVHYHTGNSGLLDNSVRAIGGDRTGAVWFGTDSGISRLDKGRWAQFPTGSVGGIAQDSSGRPWFGINQQGVATIVDDEFVFLDGPQAPRFPRALHVDQSGRLWAAGFSEGLRYYSDGEWTVVSEFPDESGVAIAENSDGTAVVCGKRSQRQRYFYVPFDPTAGGRVDGDAQTPFRECGGLRPAAQIGSGSPRRPDRPAEVCFCSTRLLCNYWVNLILPT